MDTIVRQRHKQRNCTIVHMSASRSTIIGVTTSSTEIDMALLCYGDSYGCSQVNLGDDVALHVSCISSNFASPSHRHDNTTTFFVFSWLPSS